ncbi:hypothetical protein [Streptomyces sp. NPDC096339]
MGIFSRPTPPEPEPSPQPADDGMGDSWIWEHGDRDTTPDTD